MAPTALPSFETQPPIPRVSAPPKSHSFNFLIVQRIDSPTSPLTILFVGRLFYLALAFLLCLCPWANAVIIVDDPFTDGSVTNTTGGDLGGTVYYKTTGTAGVTLAVQDDSAGIGSGNALLFTPNGNFQGFLTNFPAVQLANAGETFRISFDIRFTQTPANDGSGLRWGVYDSSGTLVTTHGGSTADDKGYGFPFNPGIASNFTIQKLSLIHI